MSIMQIDIDGTDVVLGAVGQDRRWISGQPSNVRSMGRETGTHIITAELHLEAGQRTTEAIQDFWATTQADLTSFNKDISVTYDSSAGSYLEEFTFGTDKTYSIHSFVTQTDQPTNVGVLHATLTIVVEFAVERAIAGQVGDIVVSRSYDTSGSESIALNATFGPTEGSSGDSNYINARSNLLTTYLGCLASGDINPSNGFGLIAESVDRNIELQTVSISLTSEESQWFPQNTTDLKTSSLSISRQRREGWPAEAGLAPYDIIVGGTVTLGQGAETANLNAILESLEPSIRAEVSAQTNNRLNPLSMVQGNISSDRQTGTATFSMVFVAYNVTVDSLDQVETEKETLDATEFGPDAKGISKYQRRPGKNPLTRIITLSRIGVGVVFLRPLGLAASLPIKVGAKGQGQNLDGTSTDTYILWDREESRPLPKRVGERTLVEQSVTYIYRRVSDKKSNGPITGR